MRMYFPLQTFCISPLDPDANLQDVSLGLPPGVGTGCQLISV